MSKFHKMLEAADKRRADETKATLDWLFKHGNPEDGVELPVHDDIDALGVAYTVARYAGAVSINGTIDGPGSYRFSFEAQSEGLLLLIDKASDGANNDGEGE